MEIGDRINLIPPHFRMIVLQILIPNNNRNFLSNSDLLLSLKKPYYFPQYPNSLQNSPHLFVPIIPEVV